MQEERAEVRQIGEGESCGEIIEFIIGEIDFHDEFVGADGGELADGGFVLGED